MEFESGSERFRVPKTSFQGNVLVNDAVPASTKYRNKWAVSIFPEWQRLREVQVIDQKRVRGFHQGFQTPRNR